MFKKKAIYIVGLIVFSLVLLADLAMYFLLPAGGGRGDAMPGGFDKQSFAQGEMPEGFDAGEPPQGDGSGGGEMAEMPQGGGSGGGRGFRGEMPESFDASDMPQGGNFGGRGEMPEGFGEGEFSMPEGFDASSVPTRGSSSLRVIFWPVLIVCVLGDALCIFMLIRIAKRGKGGSSDGSDEGGSDEEDDRRPRRKHTNGYLAVIAVILVAAVTVSLLPKGGAVSEMKANSTVEQAEATLGDVASVFSGSGTLQSEEAEEIAVPVTVKLKSYAVKNGERVQSGDILAEINKNSALRALYEVQSLIDELDEELAEVRDNELDDTIKARASGRVKAIYVSKGDSLASVMNEYGALMLISLGGSMSVVIESDEELSVGQSLEVTLSDGTVVEGKVQQRRSGQITVTVSDDGPAHGDSVTVASEDGAQLGQGTLEVSSPLIVTGYGGSVSRINVDVNEKVDVDDTLIKLEDTEDLARYSELLLVRAELVELASELSLMAKDGYIKAERSGIVSSLDEDIDYVPLRSSSSSTSEGQDGSEPPAGGDMPPAAPVQPDGTYAGKVTAVSYGSISVQISEQSIDGGIASVAGMDETLFTTMKQYSPDLSVPVYMYQNGQSTASNIGSIKSGDRVLIYISGGAVTQIEFIPSTDGAMAGGMQMPSMGGSFGGYQQTEEEEEEAVYEVETSVVCALTPLETVNIPVSVDELDILSFSVGQSVSVSLDALPGHSFTGTLTRINPVGENEDGGSMKYTVTVELERSEQMLDDMNASVRIELSRKEGVLTVPAAAVYEDGTRSYVCTALDDDGNPADPVDVITGGSDGEVIEILEGIAEGTAVYYEYADSVSYGSAA